MRKDKEKALVLLKQKVNGEIRITFNEISRLTGYTERQLIRLRDLIEKKDIDEMLIHGNKGRKPSITASDQEIEYIRQFKQQYPCISISQFQDIYNEDIIFNPSKKEDVIKYNLKRRSKSFFQNLYKQEGWKTPIKHKCFKGNKEIHPLREPSPRKGMLIMTDGTPHDWFENGIKWSLHMALDDANGKILSGWFMPQECIKGYCYAFKLMFKKEGIPLAIYSDRTGILWNPKQNKLTQVGRMLEELGIELIYANTPQAKGKIERMNLTIQNRLLNDIKRNNIKTYDELNEWFNKKYINYINKKFSYKEKDSESEFIPLGKTDLSKIMCIKEERTILEGNMISINNKYYIPVIKNEDIHVFYKGTKVEVWKDVFTDEVRIYKNNKIYKTKEIEGHRMDPIKKEQIRIQNQKELERVLKEREKRLQSKN